MSKYDFEIDLSQYSSTGFILKQIKKGSIVLEFGCATGRMTRYMRENLQCQVYIVEYEKSAYETALQYATDGVCDDVMNFRWLEKFAGITFDAIIFADVLEHLLEPEKVLKQAALLLKENGNIYVSLPNVTHNDILLKAYTEHFDYMETGILDNTHVHFWGMENLRELSERSGLHLKSVTGTYRVTGDTEQYTEGNRKVYPLLENILKERRCGEVYQFMMVFDLDHTGETEYVFNAPVVRSYLYPDNGHDFHEADKIEFTSVYSDGCYKAHYVLTPSKNIQRLRFDPVELQNCILRGLSIRQGEKELPVLFHNGMNMENGLFLPKDDPMVCVEVLNSEEAICIEAEIWLAGEHYLELMEEACVQKDSAYHRLCADFDAERGTLHQDIIALSETNAQLNERNTVLSGTIADLNSANAALLDSNQELNLRNCELQNMVVELKDTNACLKNNLQNLEQSNTNLHKQLEGMHVENENLRSDVGAYIVLANSKEKYVLELEEELSKTRGQVLELEQKLGEFMYLADERDKAIHYYQNLRIVKLRGFIVRVLKKMKRRIKRGIFHE